MQKPSNPVSIVAAAESEIALSHFERSLQFETDCWDVNFALSLPEPGFVLLDVRGADAYDAGHVPGAIHLPRGKMIASKLAAYPLETLFVTYCAGPHCNGATKAAISLAQLGRPVKIMIGGVTGWLDEGFTLSTEARALATLG